MSRIRSIRTLTLAGLLAIAVAVMAAPVDRAAASDTSIVSPIVGSWLATSYSPGGNSVAIMTFQADGRVVASPVTGSIPAASGVWTGGNGEYIHTTYAFRSGPSGALELERTRSVLQFDSRSNSWVTKESYSQFLDPSTLQVIAAQQGMLMRAVALPTTSSTPR
jgi:hypothetical protein